MLSSLQNPLIKQVRKLHSSKERHKQNLHLLEGSNLIKVATEVNYPLATVLATQLWIQKNISIWKKLEFLAQRIEIVSDDVMQRLATTVNPDGIVATAYRDSCQNLPPDNLRCGLILENIQDPGNLGTIIRTSVATDVDFLWLSNDSVDLDHPKVMRSSVGEWFKIKAQTENDLGAVVEKYRREGVQILATCLEAQKTHWEIDFNQPTIILLGNESQGLSEQLANLATDKIKIPLVNNVESLNVAIASAFILGEYQRQKSLHQI